MMKPSTQPLLAWKVMLLSAFVLLISKLVPLADAHGMMTSPRSRNEVAAQDGLDSGKQAGFPPKEYCSHCLNENSGVCGKTRLRNYDDYSDTTKKPMPWISDQVYQEGDIITVTSYLSTHHNGHMEVRACPLGRDSDQACFDTDGHELVFVRDIYHDMPADPEYPERGYYSGGQSGSIKDFKMEFQLPQNMYGNEVLLQWKYITANSCSPPGYSEYFGGRNSQGKKLADGYWSPGLNSCQPPYPNDGGRSNVWPEQFWNCAEVTIISKGGVNPTKAPTKNVPTLAPVPVSVPTPAPISGDRSLSCSSKKEAWEFLREMEAITIQVPSTQNILAVQSEGGAAGGVVSEGQAYGLLTSAIALASINENHQRLQEVSRKFVGYFNGWKKMCENSLEASECQSIKYCYGKPCLPGWKHESDLSALIGSGAAPDGDEDAIVGMIIALKAVENYSNRPDWYNEVQDWADRSCTQFLKDNTVLSVSKNHRLLKLGSCWGGWGLDGNNPSYHAPGHYRLMRDFQNSMSASRSYELPDYDGKSLSDAWNMLIDTSYKFLATARCPDTGLVPNWALVDEKDSNTLVKATGSFSGSGTPQGEFGAEASRTIWRIAFDALVYPAESAALSFPSLDGLLYFLVEYFEMNPTNGWEYFPNYSLQACPPKVERVFGNWEWNGFMFGPVFSALAVKASYFQRSGFTQQDMVDVACNKVSNIGQGTTYYSRSWQVISSMTLNGDVANLAGMFHDVVASPSPVTPRPTLRVTPAPTKNPTDGTNGCCSINFKTCHHPVGTFCYISQENCEGPCGKYWLPNGPIDGCTAQWESCMSDDECCGPSTCEANQCSADGWGGPTPPSPTMPSPQAVPWPMPQSPTMPSPQVMPSPQAPTEDGCCTLKYDECITYCGSTRESCLQCGGDNVWIPGAYSNCIKRWDSCTNDKSGCCGDQICYKHNEYWYQCLPPSEVPGFTPTPPPSKKPTNSLPTKFPTVAPTKRPTVDPTSTPIVAPTKAPTGLPIKNPTAPPTANTPAGSCKDEKKKLFVLTEKSCKWLALKSSSKRKNICKSNVSARINCPETCKDEC